MKWDDEVVRRVESAIVAEVTHGLESTNTTLAIAALNEIEAILAERTHPRVTLSWPVERSAETGADMIFKSATLRELLGKEQAR